MTARLDQACARMTETRRYLERVGRTTPEEWANWLAKLKLNAVQDAFALDVGPGDIAKVMAKAGLVGVIGLVATYIVGDVILYYVLALIRSFVAIPLVVAAVVGGVLLFVWKGDDWVRSWVRSQIFDKVAEKLGEGEVRTKISTGINRELDKVFSSLALSFKGEASRLLDDAAYQARRAEEEAAKYQQQFGTEDALRLQLEWVTNVHRRVGLQLITLRDLSARLRGHSPGFLLFTASSALP